MVFFSLLPYTTIFDAIVSPSRKSAFWTGDVTERRILRASLTKGRILRASLTKGRILRASLTKGRTLHASGGCAERPFSPICVHSCVPTPARATGRVHGSLDTDGPMAP